MIKIEIKNIGPIKEVSEITLNRINVFMGPQSSGKSTITKNYKFLYVGRKICGDKSIPFRISRK